VKTAQVHFVDPAKFKPNDEVLVIDSSSPHYLKGGRVISGTNGRAAGR
jgi:hypothetical protein